MRMALLFALPEEYAAFKRHMGPWQFTHRTPFKSFLHRVPPREIVLVETGMGRVGILAALDWLLGWMRPDLVIAAGFSGSLSEELAVGDVCLGESFTWLEEDLNTPFCPEFASTSFHEEDLGAREGAAGEPEAKPTVTFRMESGAKTTSRFIRFCSEHRFRPARIVTVSQPQPKPLLSPAFKDVASIMDMESYYAARFCYERQIPFLGIRSVSDGLGDEIDFDLSSITDQQGRVRILLVLASIVKSPGLVRSYYRSWERSRRAARSLGGALAGLVALPAEELGALAASISYYKT
jgi:nucleoside phosphorylase